MLRQLLQTDLPTKASVAKLRNPWVCKHLRPIAPEAPTLRPLELSQGIHQILWDLSMLLQLLKPIRLGCSHPLLLGLALFRRAARRVLQQVVQNLLLQVRRRLLIDLFHGGQYRTSSSTSSS